MRHDAESRVRTEDRSLVFSPEPPGGYRSIRSVSTRTRCWRKARWWASSPNETSYRPSSKCEPTQARVSPVSKGMTSDPLTIDPDATVGEAMDRMLGGGFRHLHRTLKSACSAAAPRSTSH